MSKKKKKKQSEPKDDGKQTGNKNTVTNSGQVKKKKGMVYISAGLAIVCVVLVIYMMGLRREVSNLDENLVNCSIELDNTIEDNKTKENKIRGLENQIERLNLGAGNYRLPEKYFNEYKDKGLDRPVDAIKSDLMQNQSLIPYAGVKTPEMYFYNRNAIYIISPNRVLANFGDGENYGWMLLKYTVGQNRKIAWKILDSYCGYYDK
jgi:hypothetical protein